ncbi:DNA recombinase [Clostridioides difficile]|uniref:recombinase family protein n=1 Tax=Bacillota TaxID=1239 RepID=UPI001C293A39|nr:MULTISPECIES: recombinase family protein [Bacillota]MDB3083670.1 DNA recombinase [Clostridioides difficile]MBZ6007570.1 recombinase family protein [Paraclostridium bifermentans]MDU0296614.1 recombinase family protein [Paraclostridium sp. MRS3W1]UOW69753.1 recombinase family protein [Paraclostridium bifermentans]GJG92712.1 DNA recombinase [Enterococcus faecium]
MRKFFYARVSSKDQTLERQIVEAKKLDIEEEYVFLEVASGKDFKRPEYQLLKRMLREDDILYIKSLDRLGRNKQMILDEWNELVKIKKVDIVILDMPLLDTTKYKDMNGLENLISDIILQLLSYMAEDERTRIKERQKEGIKAALDKGIKFGRRKIEPGDNFEEVYKKWKNNEVTAVKAMKLLDLKSNTFYRRVKEYESKK